MTMKLTRTIKQTYALWLQWYKVGQEGIDPDGFRGRPASTLYTRDEFRSGLIKCTLYCRHDFEVIDYIAAEERAEGRPVL